MKTSVAKPGMSPERHIQQTLGLVQTASLNNQYLHLSQKYAYSDGQTAVVLSCVTCPCAIASDVREALDFAVECVLAEHGLCPRKPQ